jgi:hypothetical protein
VAQGRRSLQHLYTVTLAVAQDAALNRPFPLQVRVNWLLSVIISVSCGIDHRGLLAKMAW